MRYYRLLSGGMLLSALAAVGCGSLSGTGNAPAPNSPREVPAPIRLASAQEPVPKAEPPKAEVKPEGPKEKIDLPTAIQLCTLQNFRLQASATKIAQAEADLLTASLIPNPSLYTDLQLLPIQKANLDNQLGPPQQDAIFAIPIDWLLFGKRAAAMQAQRLGVAVARADQDNAIRRAVSDTVDTFYAVLQAEAMLKIVEEEYELAKELQTIVAKLVAAKKAGELETNRIKLTVAEALQTVHGRELELATAKARLRPLIGRTAADPDFDVAGTLEVKAVVPVPELKDALVLAEAHRPDLTSDRRTIAQAGAAVHLEQRRAKPQVAVTPGWSYQYQRQITGFRNGSMLDVGVLVSLPITDRNQGNIRKAQWQLAEARYTHQADVADVLAEVEAILAAYADAVDDITLHDDPALLRAADVLHKAAEKAFEEDKRKLVELLDDRHAAIERRMRHVEFQSTYWRMLNRLNTVVGLEAYNQATGATVPIEYGKEKDKEPEPKKK